MLTALHQVVVRAYKQRCKAGRVHKVWMESSMAMAPIKGAKANGGTDEKQPGNGGDARTEQI